MTVGNLPEGATVDSDGLITLPSHSVARKTIGRVDKLDREKGNLCWMSVTGTNNKFRAIISHSKKACVLEGAIVTIGNRPRQVPRDLWDRKVGEGPGEGASTG
jgi:hypothetical protein